MPNSMWNGNYGDAEKNRRNDYDRSGRTISDVSARAVRRRGGGEEGNRSGQAGQGLKNYKSTYEGMAEERRGFSPSQQAAFGKGRRGDASAAAKGRNARKNLGD